MPTKIEKTDEIKFFEKVLTDFAHGKPLDEVKKTIMQSSVDVDDMLADDYQKHKVALNKYFQLSGIQLPIDGYCAKLIRSTQVPHSLEEFFKAMADDNLSAIAPLKKQLDEKHKVDRYLKYFFYSLIGIFALDQLAVANVFVASLFKPLADFYKFLAHSTKKLVDVGFSGMGLNLLISLYSIYSTWNNPAMSNSDKIVNTGFYLLSWGLSQAAYGLTVAVGGAVPPLAAGLFVISSIVNVCQALYNYVSAYNDFIYLPEPSADAPLNDKIQYTHSKLQLVSKARTALVAIVSAALMTGLVAAWVICPPTLLMTIGIVAGMVAVPAISYFIENKIQKKIESRVQTEVKALRDSASAEELKALDSETKDQFEFITENHESKAIGDSIISSNATTESKRPTVRNIIRNADLGVTFFKDKSKESSNKSMDFEMDEYNATKI